MIISRADVENGNGRHESQVLPYAIRPPSGELIRWNTKIPHNAAQRSGIQVGENILILAEETKNAATFSIKDIAVGILSVSSSFLSSNLKLLPLRKLCILMITLEVNFGFQNARVNTETFITANTFQDSFGFSLISSML